MQLMRIKKYFLSLKNLIFVIHDNNLRPLLMQLYPLGVKLKLHLMFQIK